MNPIMFGAQFLDEIQVPLFGARRQKVSEIVLLAGDPTADD